MAYTAADVKALREKSGAGMMDCKKALEETNGDMEAAVDFLRAKGLAAAAKKSSRTAAEGLVGVAVEGERAINPDPRRPQLDPTGLRVEGLRVEGGWGDEL